MPDQLPTQRLECVLSRVRDGEPLDEQTIRDLALASFEAGVKAGAAGAQGATPAAPDSAPPALTPRRLEVLRLVARGLTNDEIGQILGISRLTVKSHLSALFTSLEVTNRTEAAFAFQRYEATWELRSD